MSDYLSVSGSGNIGLQHIHDSNITFNQYIGKSPEYGELLERKLEIEESIAEAPTPEKRQIRECKLEEHCKLIDQFKRNVLRLAESFNAMPINTERLKEARRLFEQGKFRETDAVLKIGDLQGDQESLLAARESTAQRVEELSEKLQNNANEFLIKAQITALDFESPSRFEDTCRYFEESIRSYSSQENLLRYARFLADHRQHHRAIYWYEQLLEEFNGKLIESRLAAVLDNLACELAKIGSQNKALALHTKALEIQRRLAEKSSQLYLADVASTLNNLGILRSERNEIDAALASYSEALEIKRLLSQENPQAHLPDVAIALNNMGNLQRARNKRDAALTSFSKALEIQRRLAEDNPRAYLTDVIMTLNNLGNLQHQRDESDAALASFNEALETSKRLAQENPQVYLPDVMLTSLNLGILQSDRNEHDAALVLYNKALKISRQLTSENSETYLPYKARILLHLGILQGKRNEQDAALASYSKALDISRRLAEENPQTYQPDVAFTLANLAQFHMEIQPDRERSIAYAQEALELSTPFVPGLYYAQQCQETALSILQEWNESA